MIVDRLTSPYAAIPLERLRVAAVSDLEIPIVCEQCLARFGSISDGCRHRCPAVTIDPDPAPLPAPRPADHERWL